MHPSRPFTKWHLLTGIGVGLLISLGESLLVPKQSLPGFRSAMVAWCVPILLLMGGWVLLRCRGEDFEFYKAKAPATIESHNRLKRRYTLLGVAARVFIAIAVLRALMLLLR